ncbi:MAG: hypothetical protein FJZ95_06975 [Chloroflexi bacterium]|nr:hypothetical protein [Chloroflexota bacterium]
MRAATVGTVTIHRDIPDAGSVGNLAGALHYLMGGDPLAGAVARSLSKAVPSGRITFKEITALCGGGAEDAVLVAWKWRLLVPVRTLKSHEWDDRMLLVESNEVYEVPNIVRFLVEDALAGGGWKPDAALARLFRVMKEPRWERMPRVIRRMRQRSKGYRIDGDQIREVCCELGMGDRMDAMIGGLKGSGVMSPQMAARAEMARASSPIYEMNPSLFVD